MEKFKPIMKKGEKLTDDDIAAERELQRLRLDKIEVKKFTRKELENMELWVIQEELDHERGKEDKDGEYLDLLVAVRNQKAQEVFEDMDATMIQKELESQRGEKHQSPELLESLLEIRRKVVESLGVRELEEALQSAEGNFCNDAEYFRLLLQAYEKKTETCEELSGDFEGNVGEEYDQEEEEEDKDWQGEEGEEEEEEVFVIEKEEEIDEELGEGEEEELEEDEEEEVEELEKVEDEDKEPSNNPDEEDPYLL
jgi:hypothetical protein